MTAEDATTQHAGLSDVETAINELDKVFQPLSEAGPSNKRTRSSSRKNTSVSTPALMSVLPPSRKRQRLSWLSEEQLKKVRSPVQVYRPSSREDLIERIATFTLTLWNDRKPEGCSAVDFASNGWRCTGKKREEVSCDVCKTTWSIATPAGSAVNGEAMQRDIREKHAKSCPWRSKSCPRRFKATRWSFYWRLISFCSRPVSLAGIGATAATASRSSRASIVLSARSPLQSQAPTV